MAFFWGGALYASEKYVSSVMACACRPHVTPPALHLEISGESPSGCTVSLFGFVPSQTLDSKFLKCILKVNVSSETESCCVNLICVSGRNSDYPWMKHGFIHADVRVQQSELGGCFFRVML